MNFAIINKLFKEFIIHTEKIMTANEKYISGAEKDLLEFCDTYFTSYSESEEYCIEKHIPIDNIDSIVD